MTQNKINKITIVTIGNHAIIKLVESGQTFNPLRPHYQLIHIDINGTRTIVKDSIKDYMSLLELFNHMQLLEGLKG